MVPAAALVVLVSSWAVTRVARAEEPLFCGVPLTRQLAAGAADLFRFSLLSGTALSVEAIDTTGTIGLLKLRGISFSPIPETCQGNLDLTSTNLSGDIEISDCIGSEAGEYTITLSVVSDGPENCGVRLPCRSPLDGGLDVPGEVDSYTFPGVASDIVSLRVTAGSGIGALRLRLFDPSGLPVSGGDSCAGSIRTRLPQTGTYTTLVSTCTGPQTGGYTIRWEPPACPAMPPRTQFGYVANADSGSVSVIDVATNMTKTIVPIVSPAQAAIAAPMDIAISPNGGFAYVAYAASSSVSVINTSTNVITASIPVGLEVAAITVSPNGASAYVVPNVLERVIVIDTGTNKVRRVMTPEIGFSGNIEISRDGNSLYIVADDLAGLVTVSTVTDEVTGFVPLELGVFDALAISPNGVLVYAGTLDGIVVIDTALNRPIRTIPLSEPFDIAFSRSSDVAYASAPDDSEVVTIDTTESRVTNRILVSEFPAGVAVSPDGALLYVADLFMRASDPGVSVIDTATHTIIAGISTFGDGPTNIALTSAPSGLCVGDASGQTIVTVDEIILAVNHALNGCPGRFPTMSAPVP